MLPKLVHAVALCALAPVALALPKAEADKAVAEFVAAPGFEAVLVDLMEGEGSLYLERFRQDEQSALRVDSAVGPIEKALLIVETMEETQPDRVRYAISYGHVLEMDGEGDGGFISLVEVRRYNMGPQIHKMVQEDYGPENTGDIAEFGVGPDVAWRFAFAPVMGNLAVPLSMSRRIIGDGADQMKVDAADLCPTGPCREMFPGVYGFDLTEAGNAKATPWTGAKPIRIGKTAYSALVGNEGSRFVSAARAARCLSGILNLTETDGMWRMPAAPDGAGYDAGKPFVFFQLDQNMGQDVFTLGIAGWPVYAGPDFAQLWAKAAFWGENDPDMPQTQTVAR